MDKIKKALERARNERNGKYADSDDASTDAADVLTIEYTDTKSFSVSNTYLRDKRIVSSLEPSKFTTAVQMLRTQVLQRMKEENWTTLAITSADEAGQTLTAINLAISIAMELHYSVLLVDANLNNPNIHTYFNIKPQKGLSDYLSNNDVSLPELLIRCEQIDRLIVLPGGNAVSNSSELLASPKMGSLVDEIKNRYEKRIIIFDLPPLLNSSDALAFMPFIDAALLVVGDDKTNEKDLLTAVDLLSVTNVIGTVLNKTVY